MFGFPDIFDVTSSTGQIAIGMGNSWNDFAFWSIAITVIVATVFFLRTLFIKGGILYVAGQDEWYKRKDGHLRKGYRRTWVWTSSVTRMGTRLGYYRYHKRSRK